MRPRKNPPPRSRHGVKLRKSSSSRHGRVLCGPFSIVVGLCFLTITVTYVVLLNHLRYVGSIGSGDGGSSEKHDVHAVFIGKGKGGDDDDTAQVQHDAITRMEKMHLRDKTDDQRLPHLYPMVPYLPIFAPIPDAESLIEDTLYNLRPTLAGITAILQKFMADLHGKNKRLSQKGVNSHGRGVQPREIIDAFYSTVEKHLKPLDEAYRNTPIFEIREDESIFLSLAAFREHLLANTLQYAFDNAKHPETLFVGAIVQNCFGRELDDGTIDTSGLPCKTGAQVVGKKNGRDQTKVSDAPPDANGVADFCTNSKYQPYCDAGQIRVLYVHESESIGPAMARYYASKLWGGETYFVQTDSHLQFAVHWDEKYRTEIKATSNFPKAVLSSYPPGFDEGSGTSVRETAGARLCTCETKVEDPNPIIRIGTGRGYRGHETRPTQIPYIAAGFFFARAEFLVDVPFDPYLPWCFMGEEIALSLRAWTHGWNIYAPRTNLIAHQYRPGRMGLPKFWGSVGRTYGVPGPGLNSRLQGPVIKRIKNLAGYPDATLDQIQSEDIEYVLTDMEHYGTGTERTRDEYMAFAGISVDTTHNALKCSYIKWCNQGELD